MQKMEIRHEKQAKRFDSKLFVMQYNGFKCLYLMQKVQTASNFLKKMIDDFPFKFSSIQVDGGSDFIKDFEKLCQIKNIYLFVLPPKYNRVVERRDCTTRDEFYS